MRRYFATQIWGLLRLLFLRFGAMSTGSAGSNGNKRYRLTQQSESGRRKHNDDNLRKNRDFQSEPTMQAHNVAGGPCCPSWRLA
jgi:hypothetical protein